MNKGQVQPALRRLRQHLGQPLTLAVLAAAAVILGFSGPFGTYDAMGLPARLLYWVAVVGGTWTAGALTSDLVRAALPPVAAVLRVPLVAAGVAVAVSIVLAVISLATGGLPVDAAGWAARLAGVWLICLCIEAVGEVAARVAPAGAPLPAVPAAPSPALPAPTSLAPTSLVPVPPALLARLPFDRRGDLLALAVADHYVTVTTTKGREMLLLRLSDAVALAAPTPGLRIHRSHWVARAAIAAVRRQGDGAVVTLVTGDTVPVSRGYLPAVQAAGLLPQKGA